MGAARLPNRTLQADGPPSYARGYPQLNAQAVRQRRREALPLPTDQLRALFDMLDAALSEHGCDHTRRLTEAWIAKHGHPRDPVLAWLDSTGGYCDCEVLANSEEAVEFAIHEPGRPK
jgi:hypothetical protein